MRFYLDVTATDGQTGSANVDTHLFPSLLTVRGYSGCGTSLGVGKELSGSIFFGARADEIRPGSELSADCALADRLSGHLHLIFSLSLPSPLTKNSCLK